MAICCSGAVKDILRGEAHDRCYSAPATSPDPRWEHAKRFLDVVDLDWGTFYCACGYSMENHGRGDDEVLLGWLAEHVEHNPPAGETTNTQVTPRAARLMGV